MSSNNSQTEAEKRKLAGNDDVSGGTKKARGGNGGQTTVTEDEVEEFFAILRRIHDAVKYFEKGYGDGRKLTDEKSRLRAALEREGGEEVNGAKGELTRMGSVRKDVGFDLNAKPGSEDNQI
ncbi:hypothetical protein L1049_005832 [Liquidambar formosana]|uniref:Uncharacterized protein n=1 Tax=Liquidambar formosana TaxID=63359 RepID=A0AAP0RGJ6_LIQFO